MIHDFGHYATYCTIVHVSSTLVPWSQDSTYGIHVDIEVHRSISLCRWPFCRARILSIGHLPLYQSNFGMHAPFVQLPLLNISSHLGTKLPLHLCIHASTRTYFCTYNTPGTSQITEKLASNQNGYCLSRKFMTKCHTVSQITTQIYTTPFYIPSQMNARYASVAEKYARHVAVGADTIDY